MVNPLLIVFAHKYIYCFKTKVLNYFTQADVRQYKLSKESLVTKVLKTAPAKLIHFYHGPAAKDHQGQIILYGLIIS